MANGLPGTTTLTSKVEAAVAVAVAVVVVAAAVAAAAAGADAGAVDDGGGFHHEEQDDHPRFCVPPTCLVCSWKGRVLRVRFACFDACGMASTPTSLN